MNIVSILVVLDILLLFLWIREMWINYKTNKDDLELITNLTNKLECALIVAKEANDASDRAFKLLDELKKKTSNSKSN